MAALYAAAIAAALLPAGCAQQYVTRRDQPRNVLANPLKLLARSGPKPTARTQQLLRRYDLLALQQKQPEIALTRLEHEIKTDPGPDKICSYAELSYVHGKRLEDVRIVTHFESDYGASPKVEMPKGQVVTNIAPDFKSERWMGLLGKIVDAPFLPICRDQIDVGYDVPDQLVAERMPGFHWMTGYGDCMKELGYALRRAGIAWDNLNDVPTA